MKHSTKFVYLTIIIKIVKIQIAFVKVKNYLKNNQNAIQNLNEQKIYKIVHMDKKEFFILLKDS